MRGNDDVLHPPQWMALRQRLHLEHVQPRPGDLTRLQCRRQLRQVHNRPAPHIDQVGRRLHLAELRAPEQLLRLRCVGGGDDDEIRLGQQVPQPLRLPQCGHPLGGVGLHRVHGHHLHAERQSAPRHFAADTAQAHHAERPVRDVQVRPVPVGHDRRTDEEAVPLRLAPHGLPPALRLIADVAVEVSGEAQNVAEDVIGNHVGVQSPHVGQHAGVLGQLGEHVVLQAGRGRLHPPQLPSRP